MFWDKKEKHELPDLPPMKNLPPIPIKRHEEEFPERHALPKFPDSPTKSGFSQSAIKDAVNTDETEKSSTIELPPSENYHPQEMHEWTPKTKVTSEYIPSMPHTKTISLSPSKEKNKDLFVKIDKFHSARRSLADIQDKLEEVSDLLAKIREMKIREEQELSSWEKDLIAIKTRISDVNTNIFEKVD